MISACFARVVFLRVCAALLHCALACTVEIMCLAIYPARTRYISVLCMYVCMYVCLRGLFM